MENVTFEMANFYPTHLSHSPTKSELLVDWLSIWWGSSSSYKMARTERAVKTVGPNTLVDVVTSLV